MVTISGAAPGIDTLVHSRSMSYGIPTIAVLAGGFGYYAKSQQWQYLQKIVAEGGLLVSEYKCYQKPTNYSFPQRNSIVAGLGDIVFVPAAGVKSGSLITVDFALDMNKVVYTVPTSISDSSGW
ncbi:MAG: DNA-processing protein DprA [Candidatus Peribacteria bacterium]|nr:MAG: DNA-processing protein DprA [Candidatus Peribacteria bacterium]